MRKKDALETWSVDTEEAFKKAYDKRKGDLWRLLVDEMGFNGSWQVLEAKAFELGKKGLK